MPPLKHPKKTSDHVDESTASTPSATRFKSISIQDPLDKEETI